MLDDGVRLERRMYVNALYDLYAPLLTDRQKNVYEMHYFLDLSFAEIAKSLKISRQAVHILANRTMDRLLSLEKNLSFATKLERLEKKIQELETLIGKPKEN